MTEKKNTLRADKRWFREFLQNNWDDIELKNELFKKYKDNYLAIEDFKKGFEDTIKMVEGVLIQKIFPEFWQTRPEGMPTNQADYIKWIGHVGGGGVNRGEEVNLWWGEYNKRVDRLEEFTKITDEASFRLALEILADPMRNPLKNYDRLNTYSQMIDKIYKGPRD